MEKKNNLLVANKEELFTYRDMSNDFIENQIAILQGRPTSKKDQEEKFINMLRFNSHKFTEIEVGLLKCDFCGYSTPFKPVPKNIEFCNSYSIFRLPIS
jgi:hypothetical protein